MKNFYEYFKNTDLIAPISGVREMGAWKEHPISEVDEPLVSLGAFGDYPDVLTDSIYYGQASSSPYKKKELDGALITCFVRQSVAEKLTLASDILPEGYAFVVWDAYRPLEVQNTLYWDFVDELMDKRKMTKDEAIEYAPTFVNLASDDPSKPSPHHTGGSVDLTIIKFDDNVLGELKQCTNDSKSDNWRIAYDAEMRRQKLMRRHSTPIDVGANFDEVSDASAVMYFENKMIEGEQLEDKQIEQAMNRRVFQNILRSVGFSSFESEWWHVDFGNQFYMEQTGEPAIYGPIKLSEKNKEHELMRAQHYKGTNIIAQQGSSKLAGGVFYPASEYMGAAVSGSRQGSMTKTKHPVACRLEA